MYSIHNKGTKIVTAERNSLKTEQNDAPRKNTGHVHRNKQENLQQFVNEISD